MKVIISMIASLLITVTQALASGSGDGDSVSLLMIFFMGFGALILVFQAVPAVVLFGGMLKGLFLPAVKKPAEALSKSPDKNS
jgi:hypothetical protein